MAAVTEALTDEQKVQIARQSLAFYIGWAHKTDMDAHGGDAIPEPHHLRIIDRMEAVAPIILKLGDWESAGPERHTAIVAPPGSAKTTILSYFYEWILGRSSLEWGDDWADKFHMGHISHSADQAWRMSFAVRETIQSNDVFKVCFPKVKPSDKWAEKGWRVQGCIGKDETFSAFGIEGSISGVRWNVLGLDDLIKPEKVKESNLTKSEVEAAIYTVEQVGMRRLVEGGCAILTNTRWFERDPTSWALDQGWTHIRIQALDENDNSFWESRQIFKAETLIAERERDPEGFALQFQGEPAPESGIDFSAESLEYTYKELPWNDAVDKADNYRIVVSWDTAGTVNVRSDETAGWTAAVHLPTGKIYLLDLYHGKLLYHDLKDALRGNNLVWNPEVVWVEDKATGTSAIQELLLEGLPMVGVDAYGQKGSHGKLDVIVRQVAARMQVGQVLWPSFEYANTYKMDWLGDAKRSLLMYPRALHDDIPRALIQLVYECTLAVQGGMFRPKVQERMQWADSKTGYRVSM